ncbi:MAG: hypothetical protein AB7U82_01235 [Blastocatellales bacterium]
MNVSAQAERKSEGSTSTLGLFWRLLWAGGEDVTIGRLLAYGSIVWGIYSVVQILINGVVMDEVLAPAQIIAGAVRYPAGHPHQIYYLKAYNLFHYLAAGVWAIEPAPLAISAARNFLFLFVSTFTPFALTVLLTRRPFWGHLAVAVIVTGATLRFAGIYPMWIFPNGNSNGHIGLYTALLVVVLLLARSWRVGGLLLGLLPAIHPVMPLIIWPWSAAYLFFSRETLCRKERVRILWATGLGLAICAALAVIIFIRAADSSVVPPYNVQPNDMDGELIHRQFTSTTDVHRRLAPLWWFAYSVGPVALFAIGTLLLWNPKRDEVTGQDVSSQRTCFWLLVFSGGASLYLYAAWTLQYWTGYLPAPIEISMPYRFANFITVLLVPVTVAAMSCARSAMDDRLRGVATVMMAGLIFAAGFGFFSARRPETLYVMWGLLLAMDFYAFRRLPRRRWMSLVAILAIVSVTLAIAGERRLGGQLIPLMKSFLGSFLICCLLFGISAIKWPWRAGERKESSKTLQLAASHWLFRISWGQVALLCGCLASCLVALPRSSQDNLDRSRTRWDMISQYDRELSQWLREHGRPGEMVLPAIMPQTKLQPRINHPVLMELESLYLITYMPRLSPVIGMMMRDLYGVDYTDRDQINRMARSGRLSFFAPAWHEIWKNRKRDEWRALGRKYGFRLALSPKEAPLDLPVALPGPHWTLYEIPEI